MAERKGAAWVDRSRKSSERVAASNLGYEELKEFRDSLRNAKKEGMEAIHSFEIGQEGVESKNGFSILRAQQEHIQHAVGGIGQEDGFGFFCEQGVLVACKLAPTAGGPERLSCSTRLTRHISELSVRDGPQSVRGPQV